MNIYVGNLASEITADELKKMFSSFGEIEQMVIMHDGNTDRNVVGLQGYIEMNNKFEGVAEIKNLNGRVLTGLVISAIEDPPVSAKKIPTPSRR